MDVGLITKLCLGTVQFGLNYGIANRRGKIKEKEVFEILGYAHSLGIDTLDTAYSYGESEKTIGSFMKEKEVCFKVISKLPSSGGVSYGKVKKILDESLLNLNMDKIYGYLIHKFEDFLKYQQLIDILNSLKERKIIQKVGFSLYHPEELEIIFGKKVKFDIIQVPYSIFDRRFENYFRLLKEKNIEIYVRSVFLQGLAFIDDHSLPPKLSKARLYISKLKQLAIENNISISAICICFALLNPNIDKVVIGIDGLEQLRENIESLRFINIVEKIGSELKDLAIKDKDIVLTYMWS